MLLQAKQAAPYFRSYNQNGQLVTLGDYLGTKNVILYFYPKDDTPGCTIEAQQFTALAEEFDKLDTVVLGVSKDDCDSHCAFIAKFGLTVQLLADTNGDLCEAYGVWQEKEKEGVKKMAIIRSTFLIDKQGQLTHAEYGVNPEGHAQAMLDAIKTMG